MAEETFEDFAERMRARLNAEREAVLTAQQELAAKFAQINRELLAIGAYEAAKSGKAVPIRGTRAAPAGGSSTRSRRGSKREKLLELIRQHPDGLARKDIFERMGIKGDKSAEMSVSNALTALTKVGQVVRAQGQYRAGYGVVVAVAGLVEAT